VATNGVRLGPATVHGFSAVCVGVAASPALTRAQNEPEQHRCGTCDLHPGHQQKKGASGCRARTAPEFWDSFSTASQAAWDFFVASSASIRFCLLSAASFSASSVAVFRSCVVSEARVSQLIPENLRGRYDVVRRRSSLALCLGHGMMSPFRLDLQATVGYLPGAALRHIIRG
jgi:hypothetical protein